MGYEVTLITGDGTGPELAEAARKCVAATGVEIDWDLQEAGDFLVAMPVNVFEAENLPGFRFQFVQRLPDRLLRLLLRQNRGRIRESIQV